MNRKLFILNILLIFNHIAQSQEVEKANPRIDNVTKVTPQQLSFTLDTSKMTSASVYNSNGNLIRTLWSGIRYSAGSHSFIWDSADDSGNLVSPGNYTIKLLTHNVSWTWEGVVGNTSYKDTGNNILRGLGTTTSVLFFGDSLYYTYRYNEGSPSLSKTLFAAPQSKTQVGKKGINPNVYFSDNDGTRIYLACQAGGNNYPFIHTVDITTDTAYIFPSGQNVRVFNGITVSAAFNPIAGLGVTGFACQKTGNYMYMSIADSNRVNVFNKISGALVRTIMISNPRHIRVDPSNDNKLWLIHGAIAEKYTINGNGNLSTTNITATGFSSPVGMAIKPDGSILTIADAGTNQNLRNYNNVTGTFINTFGSSGGYFNDATVINTKFYFSDTRQVTYNNYINYAPDGSLWVGDGGNNRILHFSNTLVYIETIMYLPATYCMSVDLNKPDKVFAQYQEFNVDYSKPLLASNGSWQLTKNWGALIRANQYNPQSCLSTPLTLSNGRTYSLVPDSSGCQVVELVNMGTLRFTGIKLLYGSKFLQDGSIIRQVYKSVGTGNIIWYTKTLLKFDKNNNPVFSTEKIAEQISNLSADDPVPVNNSFPFYIEPNAISSNTFVVFNQQKGSGFHLGGVKNGVWKFKTAPPTYPKYRGDYPTDGAFDIGNGVQYAGSNVNTFDSFLIYKYHGEGWKSGETNMHSMYLDNGLFVETFGSTSANNNWNNSPAGSAGNAFSTHIIKQGGNVYLWHQDEGQHGGLHRWKANGLNTVRVLDLATINIGSKSQSYLSSDPSYSQSIDLLKCLPNQKGGYLTSHNSGWLYDSIPVLSDTHQYYYMKTGIGNYSGSADVYFSARNIAGTVSIRKEIGYKDLAINNWNLQLSLSFLGAIDNTSTDLLFDIRDAENNVIVRIKKNYHSGAIMCNNVTVANIKEPNADFTITCKASYMSISINGTNSTVPYQTGSDVLLPRYLVASIVQNKGYSWYPALDIKKAIFNINSIK